MAHARWIFLAMLVVVAAAISVSDGSGRTANVAARLVLVKADVGASYERNAAFSRPRTLAEAGSGDSAAIRRKLARNWIAGMQAGFNGLSVPWGIVSTADVFRVSDLASIDRAWHADLLRLTGGHLVQLPAGAPGTNRALVRGHLQSLATIVYMWQHGRAILSVDLTGQQGSLRPALLMTLARRQDAKAARASF